MIRTLKTLLLWLLIAALPVQGFAAAMKMSCGPEHHEIMPAVATTAPHHDHGGMVTKHRHDGAMHAHDAKSALSDKASGAYQHKSSFCSACAACCAGAVAPPSVMVWIPVSTKSESVLIVPTTLATGFIPAGLERPPRSLPA